MNPLKRLTRPAWRDDMTEQWQCHHMARKNIFLVYWLTEEDIPTLSRFSVQIGTAAINAINSKDVLQLSLIQLLCSPEGRKQSRRHDRHRKLGLILNVPVQNIIGTSSRLWLRRHALQMPDEILRHTREDFPQHILCVGRPGIKAPAASLNDDSLDPDTGMIDVLGILDARGEQPSKHTSDPISTMLTLLQMNNPTTTVLRLGIDGLSANGDDASLCVHRGMQSPWWQ